MLKGLVVLWSGVKSGDIRGKTCDNFYKNNKFVALFHIFEQEPVFMPFKPKNIRIINITANFKKPTLIPSKIMNVDFGYYSENKKSQKIIALINNP